MTTKVVKGSLWTLAGQVAPLGVSLFTTPFVIRLLGSEGYGVLILVGLIPTYLGFADFGMSMASTKFAAEAYAENNDAQEARVIRTAALLAFLPSVLIGSALFVFSDALVKLFAIPLTYEGGAALSLRLAAITFVLNILSSVLNTPQLTRLRMDLNTLIGAIPRILGLIVTPLVIYFGYGVVGAVAVLLVCSAITLMCHLIASVRLLPHLLSIDFDFSRTSGLVKVGGGMVFVTLAGLLLGNAEKGILSLALPIEQLAYYSVAFTLGSMLLLFTGAMSRSLYPALSQLQSDKENERLQTLYQIGFRLNFVWLVPAVILLIPVSGEFFERWAGPEYRVHSTAPFLILLVGIAINMLAYVPSSSLMASGKTNLLAVLYWFELIPYLGVTWILTTSFGIVGAALSWSIRVAVDLGFQIRLARRYAGVSSIGLNPRDIILAVCLIATTLTSVVLFPGSVILTLSAAVVAIIIFGTYVWRRLLTRSEKDWIGTRVRTIQVTLESVCQILC